MNTKLRTEVRVDFEKGFFKLMNNFVFRKTMENVRKVRDIKLVTTDERRNLLASKSNYYVTKYFSENLIAIEMNKAKLNVKCISRSIGMSILDISKTLMYEFWYDYIKTKCQDRGKLCYMDTDSFVIDINTEDSYKDIADDFEKGFDKSNYSKDDKRPLPVGLKKKVIGPFKDKLGGEIMKEFVGIRAKTRAYLMHDDTEHKNGKRTKKCVIKRFKVIATMYILNKSIRLH